MSKYRPNVAVILMDDEDRILVCERLDVPGAWQFPQGGVGRREGLVEALQREVQEEIGLPPGSYGILDSRGGYRYDFPAGMARRKGGRKWAGQEQTYFLCRLRPDAPPIDLHGESPEFRACRWIAPEDFAMRWLPEFKKEVYRTVMRDFFGLAVRE